MLSYIIRRLTTSRVSGISETLCDEINRHKKYKMSIFTRDILELLDTDRTHNEFMKILVEIFSNLIMNRIPQKELVMYMFYNTYLDDNDCEKYVKYLRKHGVHVSDQSFIPYLSILDDSDNHKLINRSYYIHPNLHNRNERIDIFKYMSELQTFGFNRKYRDKFKFTVEEERKYNENFIFKNRTIGSTIVNRILNPIKFINCIVLEMIDDSSPYEIVKQLKLEFSFITNN